MTKSNILTCSRCNHSWNPKINREPRYCPRCKSPYWNKARKRISKENVEKFKEMIIITHEDIINISGGEKGVRDDGGVYFSVYQILNFIEDHRGDTISIGAFIYEEFAKKHHFIDGNKRTAHVIAKIFMLIMRCHLRIEYKEAISFILKIAEYNSKVSFNEIKEWLNKNCEIIQKKDIEDYLNKILLDLVLEEKNENEED